MATEQELVAPDQQVETTGTKTSFSIDKFRSKVGNIVRPNLFRVKFMNLSPILEEMRYVIAGPLEDIEFRCERAEIPGKTIATIDDTSSGPSLKLPYDVTYSDIQLTFICSEDMFERRLFESWMEEIVASPSKDHGLGGLVRFYDDFASGAKISITQADSAGQAILKYVLHDVFPIALSPMTLAWEESNTYQRFTVTMSYRYHVMMHPLQNY
jgi:hypothetical protein